MTPHCTTRMQSPHVGCTGKQRVMGGPWNRRHVHRPGIKPLLLVQHMGPKQISITHCQHGVVVYGANQTKPGISSIRPGCSLPTNAAPTASPQGRLRPIRTPLCRARARSVLHCERYEHEIDYRLWDIGSSKSL